MEGLIHHRGVLPAVAADKGSAARRLATKLRQAFIE